MEGFHIRGVMSKVGSSYGLSWFIDLGHLGPNRPAIDDLVTCWSSVEADCTHFMQKPKLGAGRTLAHLRS